MKENFEQQHDLRKQRGEEKYSVVHVSIIEATIELLDSKVFTDVTVPLIAQQAGCSVPSIYNHFPGALPEIFQHASATVRDLGFRFNQEKVNQATGMDILEIMLEGLSEVYISHRNMSHAMASYANYAAVKGGWMPTIATTLEPLFERVRKDQELPVSVKELAHLTSVIGRGLNHFWSINGLSDEEYLELFSQSANMALKAKS